MRRLLSLLTVAVVSIAAAPALGGWAVITVQDLPQVLEVGIPSTLTFTVRQHGQTLMDGLKPSVIVRQKGSGWRWGRTEVKAEPARGVGRYQAVITPEQAGDLLVTIDANWHSAKLMLLPIPVVAAGADPEPVSSGAYGQQLFVAKGCVSCHAKRDDRQMLGRHDIAAGPDLTDRRFDAEWLATKLADPGRNRVRANDWIVMPDLGLKEREVEALVSYLNEQPTALSSAR